MVEKYKAICSDIIASMPPGGVWQWEDRFRVALTVFESVDMQAVKAVLERNFEQQWDADTIADSGSDAVRSLIKDVFGIEPGQLLFSRDSESGLLLFAAWWPWGNGVSISLRVGLFAPDAGPAVDSEAVLKEWFSL